MNHPKRLSYHPGIAVVGCAVAIAFSCGGGALQRKPDEPKPPTQTANVNFAPIASDIRFEVTRNPKLSGTPFQKIILSSPAVNVMSTDKASIERLVHKALIERQLDVVVEGGKKTTNKEGNPDATLMFDALGIVATTYDVGITFNDTTKLFDVNAAGQGKTMPTCPSGFRMKVPVFVARGRLIYGADATILSEFDVKANLFHDPAVLNTPISLPHYVPQEQRTRDLYQDGSGCGTQYHGYEYISGYYPLDVLCVEIQKKLAVHIPPDRDRFKHVEPTVDALVKNLVAQALGKSWRP